MTYEDRQAEKLTQPKFPRQGFQHACTEREERVEQPAPRFCTDAGLCFYFVMSAGLTVKAVLTQCAKGDSGFPEHFHFSS